jgi:hypothetical protein
VFVIPGRRWYEHASWIVIPKDKWAKPLHAEFCFRKACIRIYIWSSLTAKPAEASDRQGGRATPGQQVFSASFDVKDQVDASVQRAIDSASLGLR